jgi:hypothetical protein
MSWFAVKTLLRTRLLGRPKRRDSSYRAGVASVEERIVLFRARNGAEAIRKGEKEARRYADEKRTTNAYGQEVTMELLGYTEAFEIFESPGEGVEVFSAIEIIHASESRTSVVARKIGEPAGASTARLFLSSTISEAIKTRL